MSRPVRTVSLLLGGAVAGWLWASSGPTPAEGRSPESIRVIRPACTDHICGGCDGRCHDPNGVEIDHLTVRKNGHCACTPRKGGELDRAIRAAYEAWAGRARAR